MEVTFQELLISDDPEKIQSDRVCQLLGNSYWAKKGLGTGSKPPSPTPLCFGVYAGRTADWLCPLRYGFRNLYWLAGVIIDPITGGGCGKALVDAVCAP